MAKEKLTITLDSSVRAEIAEKTKDRKGGVSRWVGEACMERLKREKKKK